MQEFQAGSKNITIQHFYSNFEPGEYRIKTDKRRLQQVVLNILSNAIKFTFKEGSINIYSSLERHTITTHNPILEKPNQDKEVCVLKVSIKDNGPGISKRDQKKLFKLFGKLKSTD